MSTLSNHWLIIEPYVHLEITETEVLLYNTLNSSIEIFSEKIYYDLFKEMTNHDNLRVISINSELITKPKIKAMLQSLVKNFMGDILVSEKFHFKPVQLTPLIKIEEFAPDPRKDHSSIISNNISTFVSEFSIFINNDKCNENCYFLKNASKQHLTIKKDSDNYVELNTQIIKESVNTFSNHGLSEINILGSNIFDYSSINELLKFLNVFTFWKSYHIGFNDFCTQYLNYLKLFDEKSTLRISFYDFKYNTKQIHDIIKATMLIPNLEYDFFVYSETCLEILEKLHSSLNFSNKYRLLPFFDGNNYKFFEDNVYFSKKEVSESSLSMKDILLKEKINVLQFGKLFLNSDGCLYSNLNSQPLGNIYEDTILKMIFKEINQTKDWFILRSNVAPCSSCSYKNLCPPISNIEIYMKKFNFCE